MAATSLGFEHAGRATSPANSMVRSFMTAESHLTCAGSPQGLGLVAPRAAVGLDLVHVPDELRVVRMIAERRGVRDHEQEPARAGQRDVHPPRVDEEAELAGVVAA